MTDKIVPLRAALRGAEERSPRGHAELPADCPVRALGVEGERCWYLDALGQLRPLGPRDHSRNGFARLFAPFGSYLIKHWPRYGKSGEVSGFRAEAVADDLMDACGVRGVWSPYAKVRGRGAWRGPEGGLVLHLGRLLWLDGHTARPGERDGYVYPVLPERPGPHPDPQAGGEDGPAGELLALLRTWRWERPAIDPLLMLGWLCAAQLGGALHWRPAAWLTGDRGTGKSTLQELVKHTLVDGEGVYVSSDATAAAIRQHVEHDALPVAIDEAEAEEDNRRMDALLALSRQASSGGTVLRGGQDHSGHSFLARFPILYSSILIPPLRPADLSRIAVLNLLPLIRGSTGSAPSLRPDACRLLGRRLLRRMADCWPQWEDRLATWREALLARGYDSRGADQYGTLLAAADLALHDRAPDSDSLGELAEELANTSVSDRAEERPDWSHCLERLMTSTPPAGMTKGGQSAPFGTLLAIAARRAVLRDDTEPGKPRRPNDGERAQAQDILSACGLRFVPALDAEGRATHDAAGEWEGALAVAHSHAQLQGIFAGTHWAARSGTAGVWRQTLQRVPGAMRGAPITFRGLKQRTTLVPIGRALAAGSID